MAVFHRVKSPTQTKEVALVQKQNLEIWGKVPRLNGLYPTVEAYIGPLPADVSAGIQFTTDIPCDPGSRPGFARWQYQGPNDKTTQVTINDIDHEGQPIETDFAVLKVSEVRLRYDEIVEV